jgi:hypothetical protein
LLWNQLNERSFALANDGEFQMKLLKIAAAACALAATSAQAQTQESETAKADAPDRGVFAGDWLTVGVGAGYAPSYEGSDDYVLFPAPIAQGSIGGFDFGARGPGLYVDLIPDSNSASNVKFLAGPLFRVRMDRNSKIKDPVVRSLGKEDVAIEVGATAGVSFSKVLNPFDTLSISADIQWDVAGTHDGRLISPSISYSTPLSKAVFTSLACRQRTSTITMPTPISASMPWTARRAGCRSMKRAAVGKAMAQAYLAASTCRAMPATVDGVCSDWSATRG